MRRLLLVFAAIAAGCGGSSTPDTFDAPPSTKPDAAGAVDAKPADAPPAMFDAKPIVPDAVPIDAPKPDAVPPIDAPKPDALPIDAPPVVPDAPPPPIDAPKPDATPTIDAPPPIDACVSDPLCDGSAGAHCDGTGQTVTCAAAGACFHVTAGPTACGAGETCSAGACSCPAAGDDVGEGCSHPDQLTCGSTNVLICSTVGSCDVWTTSIDCGSQALACNNNQCVCPGNTSHNFYVGPNYDRSGAPAGLSPNGLLTSNGICTFPTLGQGLFAAASDVLLNNASTARVVAVALPQTTAVFTHESFPLVVGNRTILTTYEDNDPGVGGPGSNPNDYTISFNSRSLFGNQDLGTAVILDPLLSSGGQTLAPAAGGAAGFAGFTVQSTQQNLDCDLGDESTDECTDDDTIGGAQAGVVLLGGEVHVRAVAIHGRASDAVVTANPADDQVPTQHVLRYGLFAGDDDEFNGFGQRALSVPKLDLPALESLKAKDKRAAMQAKFKAALPTHERRPTTALVDGAWGTVDSLLVTNVGDFDPSSHDFLPQAGFGVYVDTFDQGDTETQTANRLVFSHLEIHDSYCGALIDAGSVTLTDDGSAVPNLIASSHVVADDQIFDHAEAGVIVGSEGFVDAELDGLFVDGPFDFGVFVSSDFADGSGTAEDPGVASSVRIKGGKISNVQDGFGLLVQGTGFIFDPSDDDNFTNVAGINVFTNDPSGDDVKVGGLTVTNTIITGNAEGGIEAGGGPVVFSATNVTVTNNGGHGLDAEDNGTDRVFVSFTGGVIDHNGTLGDFTGDITASGNDLDTESEGGGVLDSGAIVTISGTSITNNVEFGLGATDSEHSWAKLTVDGATISGNGADQCATNVARAATSGTHALPAISSRDAYSCREVAVLVRNSGGFLMTNSQVIDNGGPGVGVGSNALDDGDDSIACGQTVGGVAGACPNQVISGSTIARNGGNSVRDNQAFGFIAMCERAGDGTFDPLSNANGGNCNNMGVINIGQLMLTNGTRVINNKGAGIDNQGAVVLGDVLIDGNGVNAGITTAAGAAVATPQSGYVSDYGSAQMIGSAANSIVISNNARDGVEIQNGSVDAVNLHITANASHGILQNGSFGASTFKNITVDTNGGDGVFIAEAGDGEEGSAPAGQVAAKYPLDCAQAFVISGDRPTVKSLTSIHDNAGSGVTVGSSDETIQTGDICATVGDADIYGNKKYGIVTAQPDDDELFTAVKILDDDVYQNALNGLLANWVGELGDDSPGVGQKSPAPGTISQPTFSQNKFHSNGLNQVVFNGRGIAVTDSPFNVDSPTGQCDAGANAFYCYGVNGTVGVFAQGEADVTVLHSEFAGGGTGLSDYGAQAGSLISVDSSCTAVTTCP